MSYFERAITCGDPGCEKCKANLEAVTVALAHAAEKGERDE